MIIESRQNQRIKDLIKLQKRSERDSRKIFTIEGIREIEKAIATGYELKSIFYCEEIIDYQSEKIEIKDTQIEMIKVSKEVYNHIAYREESGGMIATCKPKNHDIENLKLSKNPLILVIEGIEKPGNMGAIFRTADAAGIEAIIICDPLADLYNPNAIRSSIGTVFTVPTIITTSQKAIKHLQDNNIKIFSTYLEASVPYHTIDYSGPTAIVVGTESTGISDNWIKASEANIIIPMQGIADSLNVSVSTAIVVFEACRQRGFSN